MTSIFNFPLDNEMIPCCPRVGWDDIPPEIFFYIFKKLNITALRCCMSVNRKWREIATCICQQQDLWQALVKDGMVNHGVTQHLKSTLSWKDLYYGILLWNKLPLAAAYRHHEVEKSYIRNICVYRVVDVQESDDMLMVVTDNNSDSYYRVTVFIKLNKDEQINVDNYLIPLIMPGNESVHAFVDSRNWRLVGNRVYAIDSRSVLWECTNINKALSVKALARYYGEISRRHSTIHVLEEDVYLSLMWGNLVVTKDTTMFRKVNSMEIPTKIVRRSSLNIKAPCREGSSKFNAFIKFPFAVDFIDRSEAPLSIIHYHYDDPEMTCGLQHGDVVFRGFVNGEIIINLLRSDFKHSLNVQQFDHDEVKEPAVIALEVCELKDMHKLFVATKQKLYAVLLKYPNEGLET